MSRCYAVRRLNPFSGVVEIVETERGRAMCFDGLRWEIQVAAERISSTWRGGAEPEGLAPQLYRFGIWSEADGHGCVAANPVLDIGLMHEAAEELIAAIREALPSMPFALGDRHELWLLDHLSLEPVALLESSPEAPLNATSNGAHWQAAGQFDCDFQSSSLIERGVARSEGPDQRCHTNHVEKLVHQRCGGLRQWYRRDRAGAGGGEPLFVRKELRDRIVRRDRFPETILTESWARDEDRKLVDEYLEWKAAELLTLPTLDDERRRRCESQLAGQSLKVDALWRLYPHILDHDEIDRARVEARIRRA